MVKILEINAIRSIRIRKKYGPLFDHFLLEDGHRLLQELGSRFEQEHPNDDPEAGIYQLRKCKEGKISCKSKFYTPYNPNSPSQQFWRKKYADGVLAWQGLTPEQKIPYNKKAIGKGMSGYNLFLKECLNG